MSAAFNETRFYETLGCVVIRLDRHANIWYMNRFALSLLGYERQGQLFGKPFHSVLPGDDVKSAELLALIKELPQRDCARAVVADLL